MNNSIDNSAGPMAEEWDDRNILTNLARRLGELEGTLKAFMDRWKDQDDAASLARRVTHEKIELLSMQIERLANDLRGVQQDVAELKNEVDVEIMPSVEAYENAQHRRQGAKGVWAFVWAAAVGFVGMLAYIAERVVGFLTTRP
jgi:hypothetical protein